MYNLIRLHQTENLVDMDNHVLVLDLYLYTQSAVLLMINLVCTIILQKIDPLSLNTHKICSLLAGRTQFDRNGLDLVLILM